MKTHQQTKNKQKGGLTPSNFSLRNGRSSHSNEGKSRNGEPRFDELAWGHEGFHIGADEGIGNPSSLFAEGGRGNRKGEDDPRFQEYTAVDGDSWFTLAKAWNMKQRVLRELNGVDADHVLVKGDTIIVPADDWDFTPADYDALKAEQKDLSFSPESAWMPQKLKDNLLATLKFVLDSEASPAMTEGVNIQDFYHGHVGVPRGQVTSAQSTAAEAYDAQRKSEFSKAKGESFDATFENLDKYNEALQVTEASAAKLLEKVFETDWVVVYHTFEYKSPKSGEIEPGDKRRNILTEGGGSPRQWGQQAKGSASNWQGTYASMLQFSFLIDKNGVIHATLSSADQLSVVTGYPH